MIELWIDALTKIWQIDDGRGSLVKSYRLFEKNEIPDSLDTFPCAITYLVEVESNYSGGASFDLITGVTEFHLAAGVAKSNMAYVMRFVDRIKTAAAANVTLGGLVSYFTLTPNQPNILGPLELYYGDNAPNMGLTAHWTVKTNDNVAVGG